MVKIQVYVADDPSALYKIGEMLPGHTAFSWLGEGDNEIKVYYAESERELSQNELEQTEFQEYSTNKYWINNMEEYPFLYLENENLQEDKFYYMYVMDGDKKLQYFRLKKKMIWFSSNLMKEIVMAVM